VADTPTLPVARSPIAPSAPVVVANGWEVSGKRSSASLRLTDCTPLAKVLVRASENGPTARHLGVPFGRARRDEHGTLVVGQAPEEWLLVGAVGAEREIAERVEAVAAVERDDSGLVSVVDLITHGRALLRLTGADAPKVLAKLCAIDLSDAATPNGTAFRSSVARLATDVVRDDHSAERSYLIHCERSSGQYLWDALTDAGAEFGLDPDGFRGTES
jgi:heterotetrameric sarcosine oxidase gamma subunit